MLLLPQKLSHQWKESTERGGESTQRVETDRQAILLLQPFTHTHTQHQLFLSFFLFFRLTQIFSKTCHHVAPFDYRHHDSEHLSNRLLLGLHPGRCLLQVADGARRQAQEGGHPSLREPVWIYLNEWLDVICLGILCSASSAYSEFLLLFLCIHFFFLTGKALDSCFELKK